MRRTVAIICYVLAVGGLLGCALVPKIIREAEKPAEDVLNLEAESKIETGVRVIPCRFRCPRCGHETEAEGAVLITTKDIEKKFSLDVSHEGAKFAWWQKVLRWFWGLGWIGLVLAILLFAFAPGVLGALIGRIKPARSYKRMVTALEKAQVKDNAAVSSFLSDEMTKKDKTRVKKWRAKGKI